MNGTAYFLNDAAEPMLRSWLSTFGISSDGKDKLTGDFGAFLKWLLLESKSKKLHETLSAIPVLHVPDEVREKWADQYKGLTLEDAIEEGVLAPSSANVGEDVQLRIIFDRSTPLITSEIRRKWDSWDTIFEIYFLLEKQIHRYMSDLIISATMNEQILFFMVRALRESPAEGD